MKHLITKIAVVLFMSGTFLTASAQTKDEKFAKCAAEAGMAEVKMGELGVSKATSAEVKMHAQHMIDDHSKANEELKALAAKKNIVLPSTPSKKQQKCYEKFAKCEAGSKFDKKYAKQMKCDHKKTVCYFEKEAKKGKDPELKAWAAGKVPTLKGHLEMWKTACKNLK